MSFPDEDIDYRKNPKAYRTTPDERGVFKVHPYKDELLPHWSYGDPESAEESVRELMEKFESYRDQDDFVGMDMVRKYLRMGFTRAMRYAKYPGGQKYVDGEEREPEQWADEEKREAAKVFKAAWDEVREHPAYLEAKERFEQ